MSETLENILKRWAKYEKQDDKSLWLKKEREEIDAVMRGDVKIERILRCGHCKSPVIARGSILEDTEYDATVKRTFVCPECGGIIRTDWLYKPRISGIRR